MAADGVKKQKRYNQPQPGHHTKAKVLAARRSTSISGLLAEQIELLVGAQEAYERFERAAVALLEKGFHLGDVITTSRDELNER